MSHSMAGQVAGNPSPRGLEIRVCKLESEVAQVNNQMAEIKADLRALRHDLADMGREVNQEFKAVRKEMKDDFRILFAALIFVALGMAGLMAAGFEWI